MPKIKQVGRNVKIHMITWLVYNCFILLMVSIGAQDINNAEKETIRLVISNEILGDVNRTDAQASIEGVMNEVLGKTQFLVDRIVPQIVNSIDEIKSLVNKNEVDLIGLSTLNYFKLKKTLNISPIFSIQKKSTNGIRFVVIVKKNGNIKTLEDLRSKNILNLNGFEKEIVDKWLLVEMHKQKIVNPSEIIDGFTKTTTPSKRIFSVFFDKADACILSKDEFDSACELNPQLEKNLKILIQSPPFITQVFCGNDNSEKKGIAHRKEFVEKLITIENGSKMLKLFKAVTITAIYEDQIKTIKNLYDEYEMISRKNNEL